MQFSLVENDEVTCAKTQKKLAKAYAEAGKKQIWRKQK